MLSRSWLMELSVQLKSIRLALIGVSVKPLGTAGGSKTGVVTVATWEGVLPVPLIALILK